MMPGDSLGRTDAEMVEADSASSQEAHGGDGAVWEMLTAARQLIDQGEPSQALQAVVMAMRAKGGIEAVFRTLQQAGELYRSKIQANAAMDQLASLFAECAIAEAHPLNREPTSVNATSMTIEGGSHENSILAEMGREQIVLDAFADGSSFICLQCGGLVSNHRKDEHYAYWCG